MGSDRRLLQPAAFGSIRIVCHVAVCVRPEAIGAAAARRRPAQNCSPIAQARCAAAVGPTVGGCTAPMVRKSAVRVTAATSDPISHPRQAVRLPSRRHWGGVPSAWRVSRRRRLRAIRRRCLCTGAGLPAARKKICKVAHVPLSKCEAAAHLATSF